MEHFISALKDDIPVVRELPKEFSWSTRQYYAVAIRATRIKTAPLHASMNWYLENVLPVLQRSVRCPFHSFKQIHVLNLIKTLVPGSSYAESKIITRPQELPNPFIIAKRRLNCYFSITHIIAYNDVNFIAFIKPCPEGSIHPLC